jgi:hypothetical protein
MKSAERREGARWNVRVIDGSVVVDGFLVE